MTNEGHDEPTVNRRHLLRGGAVLAGAAGATVIGAALAPTAANAADGDELVVGAENEGASTTVLTLSPAGADPTLTLVNDGGPSLRLTPTGDSYNGELKSGDIVNTDFGPFIGVDYGDGDDVDILATGRDLDELPQTVAFDAERLLDTRKTSGRTNIVRRSSSSALTSAGKLKAGQWVDVAVYTAEDEIGLSAIFATAAVIDPEKNGYLIVYPPSSNKPSTSNINYRKDVNISNAVFVAPGTYSGDYVIRIWTSQTTHLLFDLAGVVTGPSEVVAAKKAGNRRNQRQAKQLARIKKSLAR